MMEKADEEDIEIIETIPVESLLGIGDFALICSCGGQMVTPIYDKEDNVIAIRCFQCHGLIPWEALVIAAEKVDPCDT